MTTAAANVLGTIGTVCWCIQLIPQIIQNYRKKDCTGLPPVMLFLWALCGIPFSIYFVSENANIPVQIQPQIFTTLCLLAYLQVLYYPPIQMPKKKVYIIGLLFVLIGVAVEVAFIIPLRHLYMHRNVKWPSLIFGILACIALAAGLLPPYFELAKRQGRVVGINLIFLTLDCSGALFSCLSVAFDDEVDVMGIILYVIVAAMEIGIFLAHFSWCIRFKWFNKNYVEEEESEKPQEDEVVSQHSVVDEESTIENSTEEAIPKKEDEADKLSLSNEVTIDASSELRNLTSPNQLDPEKTKVDF